MITFYTVYENTFTSSPPICIHLTYFFYLVFFLYQGLTVKCWKVINEKILILFFFFHFLLYIFVVQRGFNMFFQQCMQCTPLNPFLLSLSLSNPPFFLGTSFIGFFFTDAYRIKHLICYYFIYIYICMYNLYGF
jgi:hypothetical protein